MRQRKVNSKGFLIGRELSAVLLMMFLLFAKIILCLCRSDIIFICLNSRSEYHLALSQISLRSNFIRRKANITKLLIHKSERAVPAETERFSQLRCSLAVPEIRFGFRPLRRISLAVSATGGARELCSRRYRRSISNFHFQK